MHLLKLHGQRPIPAHADGAVFDLSPLLRINQGDGMDADDGDFLQPQFGESPLGDGQPLLNVTSNAREKTYPLALHEGTPAQAQQLQGRLTWHVLRNGPLRLEEQPDGGSAPMWWDVQFARFEPETNPRRAAHGWKLGTLRVWCQPYAHTATSRLVATSLASAPATSGLSFGFVTQTPPIGELEGDQPALLDVRVRPAAGPVGMGRDGRVVIVAALPNADYVVAHPLPSLHALDRSNNVSATAWLRGEFDLLNYSRQGRVIEDEPLIAVDLQPASIYRGRNRVFAVAAANHSPGVALRGFADGRPIGPTAIASGVYREGFTLVDLGTVDISETSRASAVRVQVNGGVLPATGFHGPHSPSTVFERLRFKTILTVPEDRVALALDTNRRLLAIDGFDSAATTPLPGTVDQLGNQWATTPLASAPLYLFPASAGYAFGASAGGLTTFGAQLQLPRPEADMRIEAGFIINNSPPAGVEVMKVVDERTYVVARAFPGHSASYAIDVRVISNGSQVAYASSRPTALLPNEPHLLQLQTQGPVAAVRLISLRGVAGGGVMGETQASALAAELPGMPALRTSATGIATLPVSAQNNGRFSGIRVTALPSLPLSASQPYHFDGVEGAIARYTADNAWQADITAMGRGAIPLADVPTCAGVAAVALDVDGSDLTTSLSVEVRVRERFTFVR